MATTASSTQDDSSQIMTTDSDRQSDSSVVNTRDDTNSERDDDIGTRLTMKWIMNHFKKDWKQYYRTLELNELLYFHYKGFGKIDLMENFPHLKCLYFEGNAITSMAGLETNVELLSLYLHENCINEMAHISTLKNLKVLNLSDNCIRKIDGLAGLNIDTLYLARNRIGFEGIEDLKGLLECKSITCVDLQQNNIDDEAVIPEVFEKMPDMKVLYLQNNKVVKKIKNYRKTLTVKLPKLVYLDDRPVFKDDRRNAEAFARGGIEEERKERTIIKQEQNQKDEKNRQAFRDMLEKAKEERKAAMAAMKATADKCMADSAEAAPVEATEEKAEDQKQAEEVQEVQEEQEEQIDTKSPRDDQVDLQEQEEADDDAPELEQVDLEERRDAQKKEWLERVHAQEVERAEKQVDEAKTEFTAELAKSDEVKVEATPQADEETKTSSTTVIEASDAVTDLEELD